MNKILIAHFPDQKSVINVFASAAFIVFGWSIYSSFWKLPAWIFYLSTEDIVSVYAYSFLVNFIECILLLMGLLFINIFFSGNLWKNSFSAASVIFLFVTVGSAIFHLHLYQDPGLRDIFINSQLLWWATTISISFITSIICVKVNWIRNFLSNMAERFVIFLYIYIPLTVISFCIVFTRIVL